MSSAVAVIQSACWSGMGCAVAEPGPRTRKEALLAKQKLEPWPEMRQASIRQDEVSRSLADSGARVDANGGRWTPPRVTGDFYISCKALYVGRRAGDVCTSQVARSHTRRRARPIMEGGRPWRA